MKRIFVLLISSISFLSLSAQDIKIIFTGSGESSSVGTVLVENLTQGTSKTIEGNKTLHLHSWPVGITDLFQNENEELRFYPNPMKESTNMEFYLVEAGKTQIEVVDISGRTITKSTNTLNKGLHTYNLTGLKQGLFIVYVKSAEAIYSGKILSNNTANGIPELKYTKNQAVYNKKSGVLKSATTEVSMQYNTGDRLKFSGASGNHRTVVMDTPNGSKTVNFKFIICEDADKKNYSIVKIGDQWWMAENLAYLPSVNKPNAYSLTSSQYYVYDYEGTNVSNAKETSNYKSFGVFYNWRAAQNSCPNGWSLPSDSDWEQLAKLIAQAIGSNLTPDTNNGYHKVGDYLKNENGWNNNKNGYNDYGFSALASGHRIKSTFGTYKFFSKGIYANYWSATEYGNIYAWNYAFDYTDNFYRVYNAKENGYNIRCIKGSSSTTNPSTALKPTVTTSSSSSIEENSATLNGNVSSNGGASITQRGFYWSQSDDTPDPGDNVDVVSGTTGSFSKNISGLSENTTYYYRAFATNSEGTNIGDVVNFKTNEETTSSIVYGSFTDSRDSKKYNTVKIGTQTWMAENLAYLPSVSPSSVHSQSQAYYYVYDYDGSSVQEAKAINNYKDFGVIYNWTAAMNGSTYSNEVPSGIKGICPTGWHMPSDDEWRMLREYLINNKYGYEGSGADIAKSLSSKEGWVAYDKLGRPGNMTNTNNLSGFSGKPSGKIGYGNKFTNSGYGSFWWSSSNNNNDDIIFKRLYFNNTTLASGYESDSSYGYSIRCIKD